MSLTREQHLQENLAMLRSVREALVERGMHPHGGIQRDLKNALEKVSWQRKAGDSPFLQELEKRLQSALDLF